MNTQPEADAVPLYELLENVPPKARLVVDDGDGMGTSVIPVGRLCHEAAAALRQLLEQPEQADELEVVVKSNGHVSPLLTHMMNSRIRQSNTKQVINLYDRPEQPADWVGLTYEEAKEIYTCIHGHDSEIRLCRAIEAKLREKNGGAA